MVYHIKGDQLSFRLVLGLVREMLQCIVQLVSQHEKKKQTVTMYWPIVPEPHCVSLVIMHGTIILKSHD